MGSTGTFAPDMPHSRCDCPVHKFTKGVLDVTRQDHNYYLYPPKITKLNAKTCPKCYCFVCSAPASSCSSWHGVGQVGLKHCNGNGADYAFSQEREWFSNPFRDVLEEVDTRTASEKSKSTIPSDIAYEIQQQKRTADQIASDFERFEVGNRVRRSSPYEDPLQAMLRRMLGYGYDSDASEPGTETRTHNFTALKDRALDAFNVGRRLLPDFAQSGTIANPSKSKQQRRNYARAGESVKCLVRPWDFCTATLF